MGLVRKLKIYTKYRVRTWDCVTVPEIRLEGKWLERLGFKQGQEIEIEQTDKRIVITLRESPGQE